MIIAKKIEIDLAHRLMMHKGKCKNLHGHRYFIEIGIEDDINEEGMVIDFSQIKQILKEIIEEPYDHSCIINNKDEYKQYFEIMKQDGMNIHFVDYEPTAENFCIDWFTKLKSLLPTIKYIKIWETPTSFAYHGDYQ